uniref:Peptidase S8/S53 domain-containing protein n=1 Tax=Aegilops tauschii subsp. strangulata TaxID=200361 RepID=A0A453CK96_AEGTS
DVISLSMAPSSVSPGPAAFLNLLETQLLLATKAGVSVVQAVGNGGPDASSVVSFSPWITSVAASTTDRKYNKTIVAGNGQIFSCGGLSRNSFQPNLLVKF